MVKVRCIYQATHSNYYDLGGIYETNKDGYPYDKKGRIDSFRWDDHNARLNLGLSTFEFVSKPLFSMCISDNIVVDYNPVHTSEEYIFLQDVAEVHAQLVSLAYEKYKVGTKFKSVNDGGRIREVKPYHKHKNSVLYTVGGSSANNFIIYTPEGLDAIDENNQSCCSNPYMYSKGKWNEVVDTFFSLEVKYKKELEEVERLFPEGTKGKMRWGNISSVNCLRLGKLLIKDEDNHIRIYTPGNGILWSTVYGYSTPDKDIVPDKEEEEINPYEKCIEMFPIGCTVVSEYGSSGVVESIHKVASGHIYANKGEVILYNPKTGKYASRIGVTATSTNVVAKKSDMPKLISSNVTKLFNSNISTIESVNLKINK